MELERLRSKLEAILGCKVTLEPIDEGARSWTTVPGVGGATLYVERELSVTEKELLALLFEAGAKPAGGRERLAGTEDERQAAVLSSWLMDKLERGDAEAALPEPLAMWSPLKGIKVPLLLSGDYPERRQQTSYEELYKLLKTFFDAEVVLVPLHNKQWLILGDASLLEDRGDEESMEESLAALASGLYDMVASEWMGECHVAATYPFAPTTSLVNEVMTLRETIELGRAYRMSSNIHLPWELRLETLLDAVPMRSKLRFMKGVLQRAEPSFDPEMLQTLEAFFAENCNVSDTAKRLYIHRNTLLYRLDKFKQETGMDVRGFDEAVLVRLALLLYKVTKRR